jgi:hypothetical protein
MKYTHENSMRKAINLYCKECIYDPYAAGEGSWRNQVENCPSAGCPLWTHRPKRYPIKRKNNRQGAGKITGILRGGR